LISPTAIFARNEDHHMSAPIARAKAGTLTPQPIARSEKSLREHLSAVYALSQGSHHVFASPLGPLHFGRRHTYLPRFAFFGPHASDESWRLAFLGGFSQRDPRSSHAILSLVERLAGDVEAGHGLNLSFFPIVDAAGFFFGVPDRGLAAYHWGRAPAPEIALLERDARLQAYHGFIRVEAGPVGEDIPTIRVRGSAADLLSPDLELITTEDTEPFPVRFEAGLAGETPVAGPLSVADDLPFTPFELTLRLPSNWPDDLFRRAAATLLERFIWKYRAFQAYGQHL
jgi:hypothetical protein